MAELDRLLARDVRLRHPRRAVHLIEQTKKTGDEKDGAKNGGSGQRIGAAMKDLRHRSFSGRDASRTQEGIRPRSVPPKAELIELTSFVLK